MLTNCRGAACGDRSCRTAAAVAGQRHPYENAKKDVYGMRLLTVHMTACFIALSLTTLAHAVTLERIVSREDPKLDCAAAVMTVGLDGQVCLASSVGAGRGDMGYVLRVSRDGTQKFGGDVVANGLQNATANADGIVATANAHFQHAINLYGRNMGQIASYGDFLFKDFYDVPQHVEAGASGDFYAIDAHRQRILRVSPAGKLVKAYTFPTNVVRSSDFRVSEATSMFLIVGRDGSLRGLGFDGDVRWTLKQRGLVDMDPAGTVYVLDKAVLRRFAPQGVKSGELTESADKMALSTNQLVGANRIAVFGNELIVKRADPAELFQVYDLATGKQKRAVLSQHERVAAEFSNVMWTAGEQIPFQITFSDGASDEAVGVPPLGGIVARPTKVGTPNMDMHVWATAFGDDDWRELKRLGDQLEVPADFAGLYQIRISPTLNPQADSEYTLRTVVEVHAPNSRGTVSVWTPLNRVWWGRGEEIPVGVMARGTNGVGAVTLTLLAVSQGGSPAWATAGSEAAAPPKDAKVLLWSTNLTFAANTSTTFLLPAAFTARLAPGRYALTAAASNFTCVAQPIRIGSGLAARSPFRVTLHGDYKSLRSTADAWAFADEATDMLGRFQTLGINQTVNRTFSHGYPLAFADTADGSGLLNDLSKRLAADAGGVATQKVAFGFADAHALGALSAHGLREWLLLVGMDAALPLGASTYYAKGRTPEEYAGEIAYHTPALKAFTGFAGWDWTANWWVTDRNLRFASTNQEATFEAALNQANNTGTWHTVLDEVGDRTIGWQPDAQQGFKVALEKVATNLATASAGPYRRSEIYPPVSFSNVDEVDLHFQAEQISTPNWTAHAPDFYGRPGKPAWLHPEFYNDIGTGEMILPMSWMGIMRGADGIGAAGNLPTLGEPATDSRSGYPGTLSVFRALNEFARQYGPWLTTLRNHDRVAIVVSHRQIKLDGGRWGQAVYFWRLWEAHQSCLYARLPATFLYTEDVTPDTLKQFKALVLVSQQYEPEPALAKLLAQAKKQGLAIFADGTCRESLAKDYTPLGVTFDHVEKLNGFNNDCAFWDFPEVLLTNAPLVAAKLNAVVRSVAIVDQPEVLVSERCSGDARFVWVVNNTHSPLEPGSLWRLNNAIATRVPVVAQVTLPVEKGDIVYDVFSGQEVRSQKSGVRSQESETSLQFTADLRYAYARLYAILPRAIEKLNLEVQAKLSPGQTFTWTAAVPGIKTRLPLHVELRDAAGALLDERFTTTGAGNFTVPINAALPVTLSATELISGKTAGANTEHCSLITVHSCFGPHLRDLTISPDGQTAFLNAFNYGQNFYALDLADGKVRWTGNVGDHFAYAPVALPDGFAVQGYDLGSAEGYHLYRLDGSGQVARRFTLPGLPARMIGWAFPHIGDRINNFAVAPGGEWIAGAGNLALGLWTPDGQLLWSQDWSSTNRVIPRILALDDDRLLVAKDMTLTAYQASKGRPLWSLALDPVGEILGLSASADGRTIAVRTSLRSGHVFVVREGKVAGVLPTAADDAVLTPDGAQVAITTGRNLKLYAADGNLRWVYKADATLRYPRLSPDGKRLAMGSELGTLYVVDIATNGVRALDLGALPVPAWLPNGDLVAATWMGGVCRLDASLQEKWKVRLAAPSSALGPQPTTHSPPPTSRLTSWINADATPLPLTPNLLDARKAKVTAFAGNKPMGGRYSIAPWFDGQTNAPATPWFRWEDIGFIDNGWRGKFSLEFDASPAKLHVTAITFVEDAAHPESWLRDARLEYWDAGHEKWVFAQYLTSDAAVHTHTLKQPIDATKFRLACPSEGQWGWGWPVGNLRFAEVVFHGQ